jgi:hypothetical protein
LVVIRLAVSTTFVPLLVERAATRRLRRHHEGMD